MQEENENDVSNGSDMSQEDGLCCKISNALNNETSKENTGEKCEETSHEKLCENYSELNISDNQKTIVKKCEPCELLNTSKDAVTFCETCEEYLCKECTNIHKVSKATKSHVPVNIGQQQYQTYSLLENRNSREPCSAYENIQMTDLSFQQTEIKYQEGPSKPSANKADIKADSIILFWDPPAKFGDGDYYQICYQEVNNDGKWTFYPDEYTRPTAEITNMKSNTKFVFRVRVVYKDGNCRESPISDEFCTTTSPASRIVKKAQRIEKGLSSPITYCLPLTEVRHGRNLRAKSKKFVTGRPTPFVYKEKTIMLVGATGTGKSTLVDGLANYILGVNWSDSFRFTVVHLEPEEKNKIKNQAVSQTEWITCYTFNSEQGSRLDYRLNVIDTPGFGDTRGLQRDQQIVEQIRQLFSEAGPRGLAYIDAVCFLIKAPDARLTAVQRYIFESIMSLFGKDIKDNICSLITFSDGMDPPVLAALRESNLPFGRHFTFNNSGFFAKNTDINKFSLSPMFWEMGLKNFRAFFDYLETVQTRSLQLTKDVLDERFRLQGTVRNLRPKIDLGLDKVHQLKREIIILNENQAQIEDNSKFEYEVEETRQKKTALPKGLHVTNCIYCNFTCHENCQIPEDQNKEKCSAMNSDGNCNVCPENCHWSQHSNTPYIFKYEIVKVKKTYAEMQTKYKEATGKLLSQEQIINEMKEEINCLCKVIDTLMGIVKECNERLNKIALRPNPLSMTDHIDLMIEAEKQEQKPGYMERIEILFDFRRQAEVVPNAESFRKEAQSTLRTLASVTYDKLKNMHTRDVRPLIADSYNTLLKLLFK